MCGKSPFSCSFIASFYIISVFPSNDEVFYHICVSYDGRKTTKKTFVAIYVKHMMHITNYFHYYRLNSLFLFWLAESVQWIFEISACDVICCRLYKKLKVTGNYVWPRCMISKGNYVEFKGFQLKERTWKSPCSFNVS